MMKKIHERRAMGQAGFTLVELLVVVGILAILGGVVAFSVGSFTDKAEDTACVADLKTLQAAAEAFRADKGFYAADEAALVAAKVLQDESSNFTYTGTTGPTGSTRYVWSAKCTGTTGATGATP